MEEFNEANSGDFLQGEANKINTEKLLSDKVEYTKEDNYDSCDCESKAPDPTMDALYKFKSFQLLQFELDAIMNALSVTEKALVDSEPFTQIEVSTIRGDMRTKLTDRLVHLLEVIPQLT